MLSSYVKVSFCCTSQSVLRIILVVAKYNCSRQSHSVTQALFRDNQHEATKDVLVFTNRPQCSKQTQHNEILVCRAAPSALDAGDS